MCQAQTCVSLKAAEKLDKIQRRTVKPGQQLEMTLCEDRELLLPQLLRERGEWCTSLQEMQMLKGFVTEWGKKSPMLLFGIGRGACFTESSAREMSDADDFGWLEG